MELGSGVGEGTFPSPVSTGDGERERVFYSSALYDPHFHPENLSSCRAPALTQRSDVQAHL